MGKLLSDTVNQVSGKRVEVKKNYLRDRRSRNRYFAISRAAIAVKK